MASLKERFKSGLKAMGAGVKQAGKTAAMALAPGLAASKMISKERKKKKLREGMMKATGQSKESAAAIKRRTDIAAKRLSAQRRAAGESPRYSGVAKKQRDMSARKRAMGDRLIKQVKMMKKEKKPLK